MPAVFFGTGLIIAVFFFVRSVFKDEYLALAVAFIMTFSEWMIAWSRQARGYAALIFFLILLVFFLWRFLETSKKKYAVRINGIRDPFGGEGAPCMAAWANWLNSRKEVFRNEILDHNLSCVLQELCLVLCRGHRIVS